MLNTPEPAAPRRAAEPQRSWIFARNDFTYTPQHNGVATVDSQNFVASFIEINEATLCVNGFAVSFANPTTAYETEYYSAISNPQYACAGGDFMQTKVIWRVGYPDGETREGTTWSDVIPSVLPM